MSINVHIVCSCWKQSLPHCWLQMIYNWANNSLTSKGYEPNVHTWLHAAHALISKQAHLLSTTAVNTIRFKVNFTDPCMAMVNSHIGLLQFWLVMPHRLCSERAESCTIKSYSDAFCRQQNILNSSFCFSMFHWKWLILLWFDLNCHSKGKR
jgi:hypothetical protein